MKALYYPSVDIKNEKWLKSALLFFDEFYTIVPSEIQHPYKEYTTQYLEDIGILRAFPVNSNDSFVQSSSNSVISFLREINYHSILQLTDLLCNTSGILFRSRTAYWDATQLYSFVKGHTKDFYVLDQGLITYYMMVLANGICQHTGMSLVTDNISFCGLSNRLRLVNSYLLDKDNGLKRMCNGIMINLVINNFDISSENSIQDILQFKKRRSDQLRHFRRNLLKLTNIYERGMSLDAGVEKAYNIYINEFLPSYNDFVSSLKDAKIKFVTENALKVSLISTGSSALLPNLLGMNSSDALIMGAGLSLLAALVDWRLVKHEKIRGSPYSYLLYINKEL